MLQKKNRFFQNILGSASGITTIVVFLVIAMLLYKFCIKKREKRNQSNTFCHFNTLKEEINLATEFTELTDEEKPALDSEVKKEQRKETRNKAKIIDIHSVLNPVSNK